MDVTNQDVVVVQNTFPDKKIVELLLILQAVKEANAKTPKTTNISDIFIPCFLNKKIANMKTTTSTNSRIILGKSTIIVLNFPDLAYS